MRECWSITHHLDCVWLEYYVLGMLIFQEIRVFNTFDKDWCFALFDFLCDLSIFILSHCRC